MQNCQMLYKSGPNAGTRCMTEVPEGEKWCARHKKSAQTKEAQQMAKRARQMAKSAKQMAKQALGLGLESPDLNLMALPNEMLEEIMNKMNLTELIRLSKVNMRLAEVAKRPIESHKEDILDYFRSHGVVGVMFPENTSADLIFEIVHHLNGYRSYDTNGIRVRYTDVKNEYFINLTEKRLTLSKVVDNKIYVIERDQHMRVMPNRKEYTREEQWLVVDVDKGKALYYRQSGAPSHVYRFFNGLISAVRNSVKTSRDYASLLSRLT